MHLFSNAYDTLQEAIRKAGGIDGMTIDQHLQVAQIEAMLSVSQELSSFEDYKTAT